MRQGFGGLILGILAVLACSGCAAKQPVRPTPLPMTETPMPTVPQRTPTPLETPVPLKTRPVGKPVQGRKGEAIGPVITYFGAARADGRAVEPESVDKGGVPTYLSSAGSGFILVVEAKPGANGIEPARGIFAYVENDPTSQPDLQIESSRPLGNGSTAVCDQHRPNIGGVPAIDPPSFAPTQQVSNTLNDFSCRFETFTESQSSCTMTPNGDYSFVKPDTTAQFCMIVAKAWEFPVGDTLLSVRLRDGDGNPGPVARMRIRRPPMPTALKKK